MSTGAVERTGRPLTRREEPAERNWYAALGEKGRRAFRAAYAGYMLDAFDLIVLTLSLSAIGATFAVGTGATGALSTVTLSASAIGGILGGILADRIGRARTLMLSVAVYSLFTFLSGLAPSYEVLIAFRVFQGIGFGAEWGVGAVLVAELVRPEARGRALGIIQSAWAAGWALAVVAYLVAFELFAEQTAWRVLMCAGILPALLILYIRSRVEDPAVFREAPKAREIPLKQILRGRLLKTTIAASLLATGIQGGYYAMFTWIPTYLKEERDLTIVGTSGYLFVVIAGAFLGYLSAGWVHDRIGRRPTFALFSACAGSALVLYFAVPPGSNTTLLIVGFPLGFFASGYFSGVGAFLTELFPTRLRGSGQGFAYNFGRGIGALFPTLVGFLSAALPLAQAIAIFAVIAYGLLLVAALLLPETRGKVLEADA